MAEKKKSQQPKGLRYQYARGLKVRKVFKSQWGVLAGYLLAVSLWRWRWDWEILGWWLGGAVGWWLLVLDRWVWVYWTRPETQLAHRVRWLVSQRRIKEAWEEILRRKEEQDRLAFRSVLFQLAWLGLAFFAVTSTAGMFGKGVVMGVGLHLLYDEWKDYLKSAQLLRDWLFWPVKREVSLKETRFYLILMTVVFGLLSWVIR